MSFIYLIVFTVGPPLAADCSLNVNKMSSLASEDPLSNCRFLCNLQENDKKKSYLTLSFLPEMENVHF